MRLPWRQALTALLLLAVVTGWVSAAHYRGIAEAKAEEAARLTTENEAAAADVKRARQEAERVILETVRRRAEGEVRVAALEAARDELADENERLARSAEAEASEHDGWVRIETHRAAVASARRQAAVNDSLRQVERRGRLQERARGDALAVHVTELTAQVGVLERRDTVRVAEIAAWKAAAGRRPALSFDLGSDWLKIGAGIVLGYLAAEAR